jgi:hypothetical protein
MTLATTLALLLTGCGATNHRSKLDPVTPPAQTTRTVPPTALLDGAAPPVRLGVVIVPNGPVGELLRHVLPGAQAITAVDLKVARSDLSLRADATPYLGGVKEARGAAFQLASLTAVVVPPARGAALLHGVDFGLVRAIVTFTGSGHSGLLLRVQASRAAIVARLRSAGWVRGASGFYLRSAGILTRARLRLFPGGIVLAIPGGDAERAARQRAVPADDRSLGALLGSYPSPASFAELPPSTSCLQSVVAKEGLAPHDAAVSITVHGRASLARLQLNRASTSLRKDGLVTGSPTVRGSMITVPVMPRPGSRAALGAIVGALEDVPLYRCG